MEPTINLYSGILLLGAAHGLFLALALVNVKGGNAIAHRLLALLTVTFAADLGVDFLRESFYLVQYPKLYFIEDVTSFLYGPLAYLYVCALTSGDGFQFSGEKWWHFLPFLMSILLRIPFLSLSDDHVVALIYSDADVDASIGLWAIGGVLVSLLPIPLIGIYLGLAIRQLIHHSHAIREQFSSIERISLTWLRNLLIALGVLYVFYLLATLLPGVFGVGERIEGVMNLAIVIVIYSMGYMGLRQPVIFSMKNIDSELLAESHENAAEKAAQPERKKYQKSALDADMSSALFQEIEHHMANEKPYLDSKLTLTQLARRNRISSNYLSQIINEQTGSNFFDFINQHRVEEAKRLLADASRSRANILTVAMAAGFNSKSAFYTAFKRHANVTPSEFRKSVSAASQRTASNSQNPS